MDLIKVGEIESVSVDELLHAQAHILNHTFRFINSFSLKCAVQLEIPDIIYKHGRPMSISDRASALCIHPTKHQSLHRLMRILVQSDFFEEQNISTPNDNETKGYVLTLSSRLLLKDKTPLSVRPSLIAMLDPIFTKPWDCLGVWFQKDNDTTPFSTTYGMNMWEYAEHEPRMNHMFNEAMATDGLLSANMVLSKCKWVFEGLKSLVDVGGGTGIATKTLAKELPDMDLIVFDLPHVVAGQQGSENVKFVGGSMFDEIPPADAVMMKNILLDWDDEKCIKILRKCKEAIIGSKDKGGKVIIIDIVMGNKKNEQLKETKLYFDMLMMVSPKGKVRNEAEWRQLFNDAGFDSYKIHNIFGFRSLIEVFP